MYYRDREYRGFHPLWFCLWRLCSGCPRVRGDNLSMIKFARLRSTLKKEGARCGGDCYLWEGRVNAVCGGEVFTARKLERRPHSFIKVLMLSFF